MIRLKNAPKFAPGQDVAAMLRDAMRVAVTDSIPFSATSPATVVAAKIPAHTLLLGLMAEVTEAFNGTAPTMSLGDSDGGIAAALASSDMGSTGFYPAFVGKNYAADQDLIATFTNTSSDSAAGAIRYWLLYRTQSEERLVG